jgi:acyl-CoA synthetase (AMP-forming)/AMP-acid ligase II
LGSGTLAVEFVQQIPRSTAMKVNRALLIEERTADARN